MKIFCVGRNYVDHAKELGNEVPEEPVIFMKPPTALVKENDAVFYPAFTKNLHYEGELVVKISKNGKKISKKFASSYFEEVTIGFDLTARDVQNRLKEKGLPWEVAKGFDGAAPLGKFIPKEQALNENGNFEFDIYKNGEAVQQGNSALMMYSIEDLICYISAIFTLQTGDLIFTGTPKGVGPLEIGDVLIGKIKNIELINSIIK
jgi:2-keto-4-pentenoate hydratase/2-oxohepta-3-ene-1,7-dioic acid hydratase in catechol pathway